MSDFQKSMVRSTVPVVAGFVITLLARLNVAGWDAQVTAEVTTLVTLAYTWTVKSLERKWPKAGILLGIPGAPVYPPKPPRTLPSSEPGH